MKEYVLSLSATYLLYFFIVIAVPIFVNIGNKKNKKAWWIIAWLILTIVAGFRSSTGQDWLLYENAYENLVSHGGNFLKAELNIEVTFKLFAWISYIINGNSLLMFLLYACFSNFFALHAIYRYKDYVHPAWSTFIYTGLLYFIQYNLGRQFLAMMIIFWGIKEIIDRHLIKYVCVIIFASLFHTTALLALPLYLYGIFSGKRSGGQQFFNYLFYIMPVLAMMFINQLIYLSSLFLGNVKYNSYVLDTTMHFGLGMLLQLLMLVLVAVCNLTRKCNLKDNTNVLNISLRLYVLSSVFFFLQYFMTNFGGRIYLYFVPVEIILLGASLSNIRINPRTWRINADIPQLLLLELIVVQIVHSIVSNSQIHIPYGFRLY